MFVASRGHTILPEDLPLEMRLEPLLQLRVLAALLERHPALVLGLE